MLFRSTNGAGFDPSQLPESTGSLVEFLLWVSLFMAGCGVIGGLIGVGLKGLLRG